MTVAGPASYEHTITATQTLSALAPGIYSVFAGAAGSADPIVGIPYSGAVTGSPTTVSANATAIVTVNYTKRASEGLLWVGNTAGPITGFSSSQLSASGSPAPAMSVNAASPHAFAIDAVGGARVCPGYSDIQGAAALEVDQTGGLWIADDGDTLSYCAASQIASSTNTAPTRKLVSSAMQQASALAIDNNGNLWVADQGVGKIFQFSTAQLAAGGAQTPAVTLSSILGSISRPFSMTFDSHGDLWVSDYGDSTVVGFSPSQFQASGAPLPYAALSGSPATSNNVAIQFDAQGDLWVVNLTDTLAEYTPSELTSIGSPTPKVVIVLRAVEEPGPMAFDNSGALWLADVQKSRLLRFPPSQLATSGSPAPTVTISATSSGGNGASMALPYWLTFSPHAAGLPSN